MKAAYSNLLLVYGEEIPLVHRVQCPTMNVTKKARIVFADKVFSKHLGVGWTSVC
jgi:hypothetical protein